MKSQLSRQHDAQQSEEATHGPGVVVKDTPVPEFDRELYELRPWYHDFGVLGLDTTFLQIPLTLRERLQRSSQVAASILRRGRGRIRTSVIAGDKPRSIRELVRRIPSSHLMNQPVKEKYLLRFLSRALDELEPHPDCLELFCADGYYSCRLASLPNEARVTGVDLDPDQILRAKTITRRLGFEGLEFRHSEVGEFLEQVPGPYDLVLCAGGLYHMSDPQRLLLQIGKVARHYIVLQCVVTLETEDEDYFVQPAPGWRHGCRFTHAWLRKRLHEIGWRLVDEARAELPGNRRLRDRGSSFFLCRVA